MTFSIVARDAESGDLGCAVQSRFLAVGAAVLYARADVGAVATQALANLSYGPRGLDMLEAGATASQALEVLIASDELPHRRQSGIVDARGTTAAHTGDGCTAWAGHISADGFSCQGNMLVSGAVVHAMAEAMTERSDLALPERLANALLDGQRAGGDARGQQSAALLVVRVRGGYGGGSDRYMDLRVDDHVEPIHELERLVGLHRLYFERPHDEDLLAIGDELRSEIAARLRALKVEAPDAHDPRALWIALERWAGRENLEERMVREGSIDRTVLDILRKQST